MKGSPFLGHLGFRQVKPTPPPLFRQMEGVLFRTCLPIGGFPGQNKAIFLGVQRASGPLKTLQPQVERHLSLTG